MVIKPKKDVLYLISKKNNICTFIDKRGKSFFFKDNNYIVEKFYVVLRTCDSIYDILGVSIDSFKLVPLKESYWLNFGNFENIFLLPIVYVILLPGLLSILMSDGFEKIFGIIYILFPLYIIIYHLIYKIKRKKLNNATKQVNNSKLKKLYFLLFSGIQILSLLFVNIFLIVIFINSTDVINRLVLSIFFGCCYLFFWVFDF